MRENRDSDIDQLVELLDEYENQIADNIEMLEWEDEIK
jgi:hypothetical protein